MADPRIFVLTREGWEETLERYEWRNGEPLDPRFRDSAVEVAPGVRVALLAHGDVMTPDGQRVTTGARVAVWHEEPPVPEAHKFRQRLLGKRVQVAVDGSTVMEGMFLGFGDGGDLEILQDDGFVYHAWPLLAIKEIASEPASPPGA